MELSEVPYRHRSSAANLLVSKANRLTGLACLPLGRAPSAKEQSIWAGVCFYEMALHLMKPFDPNYSTVMNWKCLALIRLGRFEDAVRGWEEILRISDKTDGKAQRNATARLAEDQIQEYRGQANTVAAEDLNEGAASFDDPPYCMFAHEFCQLLAEGRFKKAHVLLSEKLKGSRSPSELKSEWKAMTGEADSMDIALSGNMTEWPDRQANQVGWCYFSVTNDEISEGITIVVGGTEFNTFEIDEIEFGRP